MKAREAREIADGYDGKDVTEELANCHRAIKKCAESGSYLAVVGAIAEHTERKLQLEGYFIKRTGYDETEISFRKINTSFL